MKVNIEIGELVLDGLDYHDHRRISKAIEQELTRLISENGLSKWPTPQNKTPSIDAPSFNAPSNMNPRTIGRETARSIYRGLRTKANK
jgi:hypothetical protein